MSSLSLPPDPYTALGVAKDAKLPEIRSAHRKLVLKCHPDKVQDAALKAIKQDEFQKVQQAYEILSDDTKRLQYDEQLKLFELRKEMGRGFPTERSNPFEYQVRTAEPRPNSYETRAPSYSQPTSSYPRPTQNRSHEDIMYEDNRQYHTFKKSSSYESTTDRKRPSEKDDARYRAEAAARRQEEEDRAMRAREKETKRAHGEKKKSRDKEKRKGTEDKRTRTTGTFAEDYSDDEYSPRVSERKSARQLAEEDLMYHQRAAELRRRDDEIKRRDIEHQQRMADDRERAREYKAKVEAEARKKEALMTPKAIKQEDYRREYMGAAKRKGEADSFTSAFQHPGMPRRSETYAAPATRADYNIRHAEPRDVSDDDSPKRSSASRRASETPATRRESSKSRRSPSHAKDSSRIVEPVSTPTKKPALQSHSSAPPVLPRKEPSRSKTQDHPRAPAIPSISRAATFQSDGHSRDREHRGGSGLKYAFIESDDEDRHYHSSPRISSSPPPSQRLEIRTRYGVGDDKKVTPKPADLSRHRSEMHSLNDDNYSTREQDVSHAKSSRPPMSRNLPSSESRPRTESRSASYSTYTPTPDYAHDSHADDYYSKRSYGKEPYIRDPTIVQPLHRPTLVKESSYREPKYVPSPTVKYAKPIEITRDSDHYDHHRRDQSHRSQYVRT